MQKINLNNSFLILSVILLGACSAPTENKVDATKPGAASETTVSKQANNAGHSAPLVSPTHQSYILDDKVQYAIDSLKKSKSLGEMKKGRTASEGNFFYIVSFRAKNDGSAEVTIDTDTMQVKAVDSDAYSPSPTGKEAVLLNGGPQDMFKTKLAPGETKQFLAIFDLPPSAVESGADFIVPSTKRDSQDRWVVRLDNSKSHR